MTLPAFAYIALLLLAALLSSRIMRALKLPNVTGYIITGIIMGPFVFGLLFNNFTYDGIKESPIFQYVSDIKWVSDVALGFIAFSIGTSFKTTMLKAVGKRVIVITIFEALFASLFVIGALIAAHFMFHDLVTWPLVLTLGAIASATAPAATLMVIKQYRAKGPVVDTLLPVVALDDAAALILFAVLFQIAKTIATGEGFSLYAMLWKPLIEIGISLGIGAILGLIISFMNRFFKSRNNRLIWCIFSIFAALGLTQLFRYPEMGGFELSSLLICMMSGAIYINLAKQCERTLDVMDRFTAPVFMMFFVISGACLDLSIFFNGNGLLVLGIAGVYLIFRVMGKWTGAFTGAAVTKCEPVVKKYLGFTLVPQAGVAIGLATSASQLFGANPVTQETGALIIAIILTSTLIYELFGPLITKTALTKAGEIPKEE